jgi:iron(III) transport system ATP-binding protein
VGFVEPYAGRIYVDGEDITHLPPEQRNIGLVFQSYALFPTMNVYDNIAFGLSVKKVPAKDIKERVLSIAKQVDLSDEQLYKNVSTLSGGQQQRVAIARALVLKPRILCLDEPLSNLDAKLRGQLRLELKKLQRDFGITTIYVTHDQEEALTLSDRVAVFDHGRIEQVGTPHEIYNKSQSEFVCDFIGDINTLNENIIDEINKVSPKQFDRNKSGFVRTERILSTCKTDDLICIKGKVVDREYNGTFTKYYYDINGEIIKNLEINDGLMYHALHDDVNLYINPADIMQF